MLFDLRSRGRRRTIRVVYLGLAILLGGGLVLFGVGTGSGGTGVLSALSQNGTGSASGLKIDETAVKKAEIAAKAAPNSAAAWAAYAIAAYNLSRAGNNYVSGTSTATSGFTSSGAKELDVVEAAWKHYLSLAPAKPNTGLAADVANAFGGSPGIEDWAVAETGQEILAEASPKSWSVYAYLAYDLYFAHDVDRAEIAEKTALRLAPKSERPGLVVAFSEAANQASGVTASTGTTGTTGTTAATGSTGTSG